MSALATLGTRASHIADQRLLIELAREPVAALLARLASRPEGLSSEEARERLRRVGPNVLRPPSRLPAFYEVLRMLFAPLSLLLMVLAALSWVTGETRGALLILSMVLLAALLGFVQQRRSGLAADRLRAMVSTRAEVLRDGRETQTDVLTIVPGDIIHLAVGDIVPADLRLLDSKDLFVDQASLSGESLPVDKHHGTPTPSAEAALELANLCFMGSHVVSGVGHGVVLRTGAKTLFGQVAVETAAPRAQTAFDRGIARFTTLIVRVMVVMVPTVLLINGLARDDWLEAALFAIAIAVGLTPEMLPMLVTVNLARGALALSRRRVIVKALPAVQNMGAMDVLCTDKTGTLTQNRVILERHVDVTGQPDMRVLEFAYLNSHYQSGMRNLLDLAVLRHVEVHERLHDMEGYQCIDEIPFDFERRRMSVVLEKNDRSHILICKGAVEEVMACCSEARSGDQRLPLDAALRANLDGVVASLNDEGFRVIAVAMREAPLAAHAYSLADEDRLTLLGYIAFFDPPKESAGPAIAALREAGVAVRILTGDSERVTRKVCRDVGMVVEGVVSGGVIDTLDDVALATLAESTTVFVKMTPAQKSRVIRALQSRGHVVGCLGDGINDGPGLRAADVGISVDSAVDIARESADIILLEKSLLVLHQGVLEGRRVFANLMKYIRMSSSSSFGNMFSMLGASALLPFLPMAPVHVLLNNLLYDISQVAVPADTVDAEALRRPHDWDIGRITRTMLVMGPVSSLFDYATFGLMWFVLGATSPAHAALFQTGWFVESLLSQTLIVHVLRTERVPFRESAPAPALLATTLGVCAFGVLLPYTPLGASLGLVPLPPLYWLAMAVLLPAYFALTQWVKVRLAAARR